MRIRSTRFRWLLVCCFLVTSAGLLPKAIRAETRTAASLTPEAVWEAINAAKDGDTVQLPAGKAVWTKGWNSGHGAKIKAIIIQGAGIDKTVICDGKEGPGAPLFYLPGVEGKPFRITGITLDGTGYRNAGNYGGLMTILGTCKNFRIDHCKFRNTDGMLGIAGDTYGLVDHCRFEADESHGGNVQPIAFSGPGLVNFSKPLSLGTAQALYLEDNEVYIAKSAGKDGKRSGNNPWIAPNNGSRLVVRHNKIVNSELEIYRAGINKGHGSQQAEIYDNEFSTDDDVSQIIMTIAGGIAIVYNNKATGDHYWTPPAIMLGNERAMRDLPGFPKADGKQPMDGNQIPAGQVGAGYPCFGQPGWATTADGKLKLTPCYAWDNTLNGKPLLMAVIGRAGADERETMKEDREFHNKKAPEDYYKPYVYPHPLQEGWEALMKSAAGSAGADSGSSPTKAPAGKP